MMLFFLVTQNLWIFTLVKYYMMNVILELIYVLLQYYLFYNLKKNLSSN